MIKLCLNFMASFTLDLRNILPMLIERLVIVNSVWSKQNYIFFFMSNLSTDSDN